MNTNAVLVGGIIVLIAIGGFIFYTNSQDTDSTTNATSTPSGTGQVTPPAQSQAKAPSVVTDMGVAPSNSTAVVTGKVTPNGAPTAYWYEYGESATLGSKTAAQAIGSGFSEIASPGYITGLRNNTRYNFRLTAQNAYGTVSGATYNFSTNNNPPAQGTPPSASTNAAEDVTRGSAILNAHVDPNASQTTYWFEYGVTTDFGHVTILQSGGSGDASVAVSAPASGLNPLTKYYFRVNAQNQYGTVNGSTQNFTTKGPASATAPTVETNNATAVSTSTAILRGAVDPNGAETTYWFEYSTDSRLGSALLKTTPQKSAGSGSSNVSVNEGVSSLDPRTTYFVRLVAQNSQGLTRGDRETFKTKP